jgi:quercetin dioxygenase-like cupin family protein
MSEDRFIMLAPGEVRPGRLPLPPAFAVKATTEDTEGRLSLLEVSVTLDIPRHVHATEDEVGYVLDGEVEIEFAGRTHSATAGASFLLPHGVPHAIRRMSETPPRVLQISAPGGWENLVEDLIEAGPLILTDGKLDPVKINPIAMPYGVTYE